MVSTSPKKDVGNTSGGATSNNAVIAMKTTASTSTGIGCCCAISLFPWTRRWTQPSVDANQSVESQIITQGQSSGGCESASNVVVNGEKEEDVHSISRDSHAGPNIVELARESFFARGLDLGDDSTAVSSGDGIETLSSFAEEERLASLLQEVQLIGNTETNSEQHEELPRNSHHNIGERSTAVSSGDGLETISSSAEGERLESLLQEVQSIGNTETNSEQHEELPLNSHENIGELSTAVSSGDGLETISSSSEGERLASLLQEV